LRRGDPFFYGARGWFVRPNHSKGGFLNYKRDANLDGGGGFKGTVRKNHIRNGSIGGESSECLLGGDCGSWGESGHADSRINTF